MMKRKQNQELSVRQAGAMGGAATFAKYGRAHFQAIGRKGQASQAAKITKNERHNWGTLGGRPRKRPYPIYRGETDNK